MDTCHCIHNEFKEVCRQCKKEKLLENFKKSFYNKEETNSDSEPDLETCLKATKYDKEFIKTITFEEVNSFVIEKLCDDSVPIQSTSTSTHSELQENINKKINNYIDNLNEEEIPPSRKDYFAKRKKPQKFIIFKKISAIKGQKKVEFPKKVAWVLEYPTEKYKCMLQKAKTLYCDKKLDGILEILHYSNRYFQQKQKNEWNPVMFVCGPERSKKKLNRIYKKSTFILFFFVIINKVRIS